MSRAKVALKPPGVDLAGFPMRRASNRRDLYRVHRRDLGPWFFGSSGAGRFDLWDGRGTCYLALDAATAAREVLGAELHGQGTVYSGFVADRVVSRLRLPSARTVADLCAERAADFGVTREIHTLVPYSVPQAWAAELDAVAAGGVLYQTRFTTAAKANGLAIFGSAGAEDWPDDAAPVPFAHAVQAEPIVIERAPRTARIVRPPARG